MYYLTMLKIIRHQYGITFVLDNNIRQAVNKVTTTLICYLLNSNSPGNPLIGVFSYEEKDNYDRSIR